jgi:hypothetical protein
MKKILETINTFDIDNEKNIMVIKCKKYNIILPIKNGSVQVNISNELKENIGINEININDNIITGMTEVASRQLLYSGFLKRLPHSSSQEIRLPVRLRPQ